MNTAATGETFWGGFKHEKTWVPTSKDWPGTHPQKLFLSALDARYLPSSGGLVKQSSNAIRKQLASPSYAAGMITRRTLNHALFFWTHSLGWIVTSLILVRRQPAAFILPLPLGAVIGWLGTWPGEYMVKKIHEKRDRDLSGLQKAFSATNSFTGKIRTGLNYYRIFPGVIAVLSLALHQKGHLLTPLQQRILSVGSALLVGGVGGHYLGNTFKRDGEKERQ